MLTANILAVALNLWLGATDPRTNAILIPNSVPLTEEGRYESPRSFDRTVDYFNRFYAGAVHIIPVVNQPGLKAKHVRSLRRKTKWEGVNVYEIRGKVQYFVLPRDAVLAELKAIAEAEAAAKAKAEAQASEND